MALADVDEAEEVSDLGSEHREGVPQDIGIRTALGRDEEGLHASGTGMNSLSRAQPPSTSGPYCQTTSVSRFSALPASTRRSE